jgi:hypothetical protein
MRGTIVKVLKRLSPNSQTVQFTLSGAQPCKSGQSWICHCPAHNTPSTSQSCLCIPLLPRLWLPLSRSFPAPVVCPIVECHVKGLTRLKPVQNGSFHSADEHRCSHSTTGIDASVLIPEKLCLVGLGHGCSPSTQRRAFGCF